VTLLLDVLLPAAWLLFGAAFFRVIAQPRIDIVARLGPGPGNQRRLRLAIQNNHRRDISGPIEVSVVLGEECVLHVPNEIEMYVGPYARHTSWENISAHFSGNRLIIEIRRMPAMRTFTFDVPFPEATQRVSGAIWGARPSTEAGALASIARFRMGWSVRYVGTAKAMTPRHGYRKRDRRGPRRSVARRPPPFSESRKWGTIIRKGDLGVLLLGEAMVAITYVAVLRALPFRSDLAIWQRFTAKLAEPHVFASVLISVIPLVALILVSSTLFFLVRARWPITAQGYREPQRLPVRMMPTKP